ncbi:MAG: hypothetical protein KBF97_08280 [Bacteroidetes bacterium]|nr:hypothetical protein [Bacteroidota bacterium]
MNKIIFQVGLLSFCVSVVIFSILGNDMLDVVSKSFIVFIAAIVTMVGIVVAASMLSEKQKTEPENNTAA